MQSCPTDLARVLSEVTAPVFDAVSYGYDQPNAHPITISNIGNWQSTVSHVTISGHDFILSGSGAAVSAGTSSTTWTVQPAAELSVDTHTVTITVTQDNGAITTAEVTFHVTKAIQSAPTALIEKNKTHDSVLLASIADNTNGAKVQYSSDGGLTWQDAPHFTNRPHDLSLCSALWRNTQSCSFSCKRDYRDDYAQGFVKSAYLSCCHHTIRQRRYHILLTASPVRGGKVTISPLGYPVDQVMVTDQNGNPISIKDNGDGTYSFRQPAGKVIIKVQFIQMQSEALPFTDVSEDAWSAEAVQWTVASPQALRQPPFSLMLTALAPK